MKIKNSFVLVILPLLVLLVLPLAGSAEVATTLNPAISPTTINSVAPGETISVTFSASGFRYQNRVKWSLLNSLLPTGFSVKPVCSSGTSCLYSNKAVFSGKTSRVGNYNFSVLATQGYKRVSNKFTLTVTNDPIETGCSAIVPVCDENSEIVTDDVTGCQICRPINVECMTLPNCVEGHTPMNTGLLDKNGCPLTICVPSNVDTSKCLPVVYSTSTTGSLLVRLAKPDQKSVSICRAKPGQPHLKITLAPVGSSSFYPVKVVANPN